MARRVITQILDDLDGTEGARTVTFSFEGKSYEIDLSPANAARIASALEPFIAASRVVVGHGKQPRPSAQASAKQARDYDLAALREWAARAEVTLPSRGRIPTSVIEAYKASGRK